MKKNLIWCEVKCLRCGRVASLSGWYSPERIKKLKAQTKDWQEHEDYSIICPDCASELKTINNYKWEQ
jgi:hypothetical protein